MECTECSLVQQETNLYLCDDGGNMTIPYYFPFPSNKAVESLAIHQISLSSSKVSGGQSKNLRGPQLWVQLWDTMIRGHGFPTWIHVANKIGM